MAPSDSFIERPPARFHRTVTQDPPPPDSKPNTKFRDKVRRRYVGPKRENKVSMEVFMDPPIREDLKALAVTYGLGAQEFAERLLVNAIVKSHTRVEEGRERLKQASGNTTRAKLEVLREQSRFDDYDILRSP